MSDSYLPTKDADLLAWSNNVATTVGAAPTEFGATPELAADYLAKQEAFSSALSTWLTPATRTPMARAAKDSTREILRAASRSLVNLIQATPTVTDEQRTQLNITVRDKERTPVGPPTSAPLLTVTGVNGRQVSLRLTDAENPTRRAKPRHVEGATLMTYVGETPPATAEGWVLQGSVTRNTTTIEFPATVPAGSKVFITAFWYAPRGQNGPACLPVAAHLQFDGDLILAS